MFMQSKFFAISYKIFVDITHMFAISALLLIKTGEKTVDVFRSINRVWEPSLQAFVYQRKTPLNLKSLGPIQSVFYVHWKKASSEQR